MPDVFYLDVSRCTGCRSCEVACAREHHGRANIFVQVVDERLAFPMHCRHCEDSPCITVCPTEAIKRLDAGMVAIASMQCIGCQLCSLACPFGAIWFDTLNKVARKCDACLGRLESGGKPACVTTCSARALAYGDFLEISALAKSRGAVTVIQRAGGTHGTLVNIPSSLAGERSNR